MLKDDREDDDISKKIEKILLRNLTDFSKYDLDNNTFYFAKSTLDLAVLGSTIEIEALMQEELTPESFRGLFPCQSCSKDTVGAYGVCKCCGYQNILGG